MLEGTRDVPLEITAKMYGPFPERLGRIAIRPYMVDESINPYMFSRYED